MRSTERVSQMNDVITGIARRSSYKFLTKSAEEISQDLWMHILEKEEEAGKDLDLDLIAKICYDKIVDMQRFDARRNMSSLDQMLEGQDDDDDSSSQFGNSCFQSPASTKRIMIEELFNLFPKGSKERIFLEYWGTAAGIHDFGYKGNGCHNDGYTESDLAHELGFSGTSNRAFKKFRSNMRVIVATYLDIKL